MIKSLSMALVILLASLSTGAGRATAQHQHGGASHDMSAMPTQDVLVDGVVVGFAVMANPEHLEMLKDMNMEEDIEAGTTHNITVVLKEQETQRPITGARVSMRVVDPSGKDQIKTLKFDPSMDTYDGYFDMGRRGTYQILVIARYGDQKKTAGVHYEIP